MRESQNGLICSYWVNHSQDIGVQSWDLWWEIRTKFGYFLNKYRDNRRNMKKYEETGIKYNITPRKLILYFKDVVVGCGHNQ